MELAEASSAILNRPAALTVSEDYEKHRGEKILIVDDVPSFRESVIDIFTDTDFSFIEAGSVEEARGILDVDRDVRIILLDLELPGETGTKVLDHIIERSSNYRVIILTGHDELLPAHEAAIYKVFYYLSKSEKGLTRQSLRFAVEQAHQDLKRENLAKRDESDRFDDVILNRYPAPFTYIYQELKSDLLGLETLTRQRDMFRLLLNFSAVALMCEYFRGDRRTDELDARVRERLYRPTLSDWLNIITEIIKRKGELQTTFFLDKFSAFFTDENHRHLGALIEMLDRYLGQSVKLSEFEYQEVIQRCGGLLVPLLQDYQFITNFLLFHVSSIKPVRGEYEYRLRECTGANPQLLFSRRSFNFLTNSDEIQLVNLGTEQFCTQHPFIILEHCKRCEQWEIFFYVAFADDRLHYTSYKTGHTFSTETGADDLMVLIGETP